MKQEIENIIKKNLPEKEIAQFGRETSWEMEHANGFNQALSQINTSLIADEVLKVVVEKIKELPAFTSISDKCMGKVSDEAKKPRWGTNYLERETVLDLLSTLSPNK